jgi:hypothetical protein
MKNIGRLFNLKTLLVVLVLLIIGGLTATTAYFYYEYKQIKDNPDMIAQEEVKNVTERIRKYMELPSDEEPTIATITDQEKLKDQEFFKNAQNGDKVLIYAKAAKAILFRPSTSRVIEFAPLIVDPSQGGVEADQQTSQAEPVKVAILNGTTVSGLTNEYEDVLAKFSNLVIVNKANAAKTDYTENLVVALNEDAAAATAISEKIDGKVVNTLPEGETKPEADVVVIVGKEL